MALEYRVGLMWHGDAVAGATATLTESRFSKLAVELETSGFQPEAIVYNDDCLEKVRTQALKLNALQIWVNPIEGGRNRSKLDQMLRELSTSGVQVSSHPDTILKMGTKQVLIDTQAMSWGSDVTAYTSLEQLSQELPNRLIKGPRVLKQLRGHSGGGIWKVTQSLESDHVLLRHAQRGRVEEMVSKAELLSRMEPYFESSGRMIDQAYQSRLIEGITRVYMVEKRVGGFGHQAINALYPSTPGEAPESAPLPGPRLYYPPTQLEFQRLGNLMETQWVADLQSCLGLETRDLPLLWDADFLLGPQDANGQDTYVLCEINVSCVSP